MRGRVPRMFFLRGQFFRRACLYQNQCQNWKEGGSHMSFLAEGQHDLPGCVSEFRFRGALHICWHSWRRRSRPFGDVCRSLGVWRCSREGATSLAAYPSELWCGRGGILLSKHKEKLRCCYFNKNMSSRASPVFFNPGSFIFELGKNSLSLKLAAEKIHVSLRGNFDIAVQTSLTGLHYIVLQWNLFMMNTSSEAFLFMTSASIPCPCTIFEARYFVNAIGRSWVGLGVRPLRGDPYCISSYGWPWDLQRNNNDNMAKTREKIWFQGFFSKIICAGYPTIGIQWLSNQFHPHDLIFLLLAFGHGEHTLYVVPTLIQKP